MPGRPAQLAAHLCSRLCAACAHALPTAPHHGKKTQERGMLRDEGRDGKKARDGGWEEEEEKRGWREEQQEEGEGDYKAVRERRRGKGRGGGVKVQGPMK